MSWLKETGASGEAGAKKREKECEKESGKGREDISRDISIA